MTIRSILLGEDIQRHLPVAWNPGPESGSANPHLLIVGQSGYGKTYAIQCLLSELSEAGGSSIVFDYAQGFVASTLHSTFVRSAKPHEILASTKGININPLTISLNDINGPINVAVRVSDIFARIYQIGVQQHSLLRDVILATYENAGVVRDRPRTWQLRMPTLTDVFELITAYSEDKEHPFFSVAKSLRSHISSFFIFDTFRRGGEEISWQSMFQGTPQCFIIQLHGLEDKTEKMVTEFLLWDLYNYLRSAGPQGLRLFAVLDEAHKFASRRDSEDTPVNKLLREARKFGLGLILASQQPEDFSMVALSNTATKLIFHTADRRFLLSKSIAQNFPDLGKPDEIASIMSRLPRGQALYLQRDRATVISVTSFEDRPSVRYRLAQLLGY